ncbi:MAG: GNAT family N-acetyltransferase [Terrimicrobiaceae bacterium]|nr:GNAT family N-acetyltransferase [Terrimicrobiaceae bacterium]
MTTSANTPKRRPNLSLRPARPDDALTLRRWETSPHLAGLLGDDDWQWETALDQHGAERKPFLAELDGRPIGFLEILDPSRDPELYWGETQAGTRAIDLWIGEPEFIGRGFGRDMMRQAVNLCFADPAVHTILVDPLVSNQAAQRFYERCGFQFAAERRFGHDLCRVYKLARARHERTPLF